MSEISTWSTTPANNANLPDIPMFEGMAPAQLNDSIRVIMAEIRRAWIAKDFSNFNDAEKSAAIAGLGVAENDLGNVDPATGRANLGITLAPTDFAAGDVKITMAEVYPGWLNMDGRTIGAAGSGATSRANADCEALFTVLWTFYSNTVLPIQNSAGVADVRGATAAADFAAGKRMPLFDTRASFPRGQDGGRGIDLDRVMGTEQLDALQGHIHITALNQNFAGAGIPAFEDGAGVTNGNYSSGGPVTDGVNGAPRIANETRPRNWCVKFVIKL